jgi:all-trans-8'-apo-beta-carotenal 15,15'-oxygenase
MNVSSPARADSPPHLERPAYSPPWRGAVRDLPREHGFEPLAVQGKLPADLVGTLYRNGPGRFSAGGEAYGHWFDGDGAMSAVRLDGGRAYGASRLVQTEGLLREQRAGKRLFGGYDTPMKRPLREIFLNDGKNAANTAVLLWQERVFATCEAGMPHEMSARDLSTIGETDLGVVRGAFSAHHHRVPARATMYNFGVAHGPKGTTVTAYALPDRGVATRVGSFAIRGVRLIHDFAVTDKHLVFFIAPMRLSLVRTLLRKSPVSNAIWDASEGAEIVVMPIDAPSRILRFRTDAFMMEHVVNAYEDGDSIAIDYVHYADSRALEGFVRGVVRGAIEAPLGSSIRRARVDPARSTIRFETLLARAVELPRVSPHVDAKKHRFAYYVATSERDFFDGLLKQDLETGRVDRYSPGAHTYAGEGVVVPKRDGAAEDDAWLLTLVYDAREDRSRLEILDARAIEDGPVATCRFDHAIPMGFHGQWAPARA